MTTVIAEIVIVVYAMVGAYTLGFVRGVREEFGINAPIRWQITAFFLWPLLFALALRAKLKEPT